LYLCPWEESRRWEDVKFEKIGGHGGYMRSLSARPYFEVQRGLWWSLRGNMSDRGMCTSDGGSDEVSRADCFSSSGTTAV
jgi:hypothetical protein